MSRLFPRAVATLGIVACLALVFAVRAPAVHAQGDVPERRMGVHWRDGVPQVQFSAVDLVDTSVRRKLSSGLPQTLVTRVYAYAAGGEPIAVAPRSCRITFDLWEEMYRVEIQEDPRNVEESYPDLQSVLHRCLVADGLPIGDGDDYMRIGATRLYFAVLIELNPLSPDTVARLRRWLSRPAGGGRIGGDAFFGSFVSLFVNRQIGSAERLLRFRSQWVAVER